MTKVMKAYKFRLYPNKEQQFILNQWIGCSRWVWNYMLDFNKRKYEQENKFVFYVEMNNMLPELKKQEETIWLSDAPSQVLQQKCQDLGNAMGISFKRKECGFPKFKSKKLDQSGIRFPQGWHIQGNRINLPKLKGIKFKQHREIEGKMSSCTITKDRCGDWWVSILTSHEPTPLKDIDPTLSVGIDVGLKEFAVTSDGEIIKNPRFLKKAERRLIQRQRALSRSQKGSNNKERDRIRLAKTHRKVARQRKDFINKFVSSITKMNDVVCVEDLNIAGMKKNHRLAKSIGDVSWGQMYNRLEQKLTEERKMLIKIDQFAPSSKTCSCCGSKQDMPLNVRTYKCNNCGLVLDRDFNAALNIRNWALRQRFNLAPTVGTAESHASGDMIFVGKSADEADESLVRR